MLSYVALITYMASIVAQLYYYIKRLERTIELEKCVKLSDLAIALFASYCPILNSIAAIEHMFDTYKREKGENK